MITLTAAAIEQLRLAAQNSDAAHLALRIAVRELADGAFDYGLGWDEVHDDDMSFDFKGVEVVFAPQYGPKLKGMTIDYVELAPGQFGFIFLNPNDPHFVPPQEEGADGGCGCGSGGCG